MPPKRTLPDSPSNNDSDNGKRPREAAEDDAPLRRDAVQDLGGGAASCAGEQKTSSPSTFTASDEEQPATVGADGSETSPHSHAAQTPTADSRSLFAHIDYVPNDVVQRLMPFVRKSDEVNHRYSLASIPPHATWGTSSATDMFLCVDNKPITLWAVGNTESPWFVTLDGDPHSRVNIGFRLPYQGDLAIAKRLYEKARPRQTDIGDVIFSAKRMTVYGSKGGKTIIPFKNVYDASDRFRAKSSMTQLPAGVLGKRDIVLVKSLFTRWRKDRNRDDRKKWVRWDVGFELQAVNLLYEVPLDLVDQLIQEPEPVPDFDDDL